MGKGPNGLSQSPWPIWLSSLDWHNGPVIVKGGQMAKWQCGKQMSQGADGKKEMMAEGKMGRRIRNPFKNKCQKEHLGGGDDKRQGARGEWGYWIG
jgi:hypothetical protein